MIMKRPSTRYGRIWDGRYSKKILVMPLRIVVKKKLKTKFGGIDIANSEPFSAHRNGFGISPYLQEKLTYIGRFEVYDQGSELAECLLGLKISSSQIYRLTNYYGEVIGSDLTEIELESEPLTKDDVVYAQADGAMILTDDGYKENKLARIFDSNSLKESVVEDRGGHIESSLYVTHLGTSADFSAKLVPHLDRFAHLGSNLVFISDGAVWLRQMMETRYPKATLILDMFHAMEYIGEVGVAAFGQKKSAQWIENQRILLFNSKIDTVLASIQELKIEEKLRETTYKYLESNRDRMDYLAYRKRGLLIGSGAIESANRTVLQKRCKRSGQRWTISGAQRVLNLRACYMSGAWHIVRNHIEPYDKPIAA